MMQELLSLGSDPEFFIATREGDIVSSQTARVKGRKERPKPMALGHIHRDNVLVEINVPQAYNCDEWVHNHVKVLDCAESEISDNYNLVTIASHIMDPGELVSPEALIFGCEPDFNAWNGGEINPQPDPCTDLRSASGHIHYGLRHPEFELGLAVVRAHDCILGVPSVLMDSDTERRKLYGKAGAYRPKPYGVEARCLSNFWMRNEKLMAWAWRNAKRAVDFANDVEDWSEFEVVQDILNNHDVDQAEYFCRSLNLEVING